MVLFQFVPHSLPLPHPGCVHKSVLYICILAYWSEWPLSKNLQTVNAGEGVEKREPYSAAGNVNSYCHYGELSGGSLKKTGNETIMPVHAKSLQSCPTLCDPMDFSPPGSSVHGTLQVRILE